MICKLNWEKQKWNRTWISRCHTHGQRTQSSIFWMKPSTIRSEMIYWFNPLTIKALFPILWWVLRCCSLNSRPSILRRCTTKPSNAASLRTFTSLKPLATSSNNTTPTRFRRVSLLRSWKWKEANNVAQSITGDHRQAKIPRLSTYDQMPWLEAKKVLRPWILKFIGSMPTWVKLIKLTHRHLWTWVQKLRSTQG